MGIKKFFKMKPPPEDTVEQNRQNLTDLGITVKGTHKARKEKFAAYGQFARDRGTEKFYAPPGYEDFARPEEPEEDLNKAEPDGEESEQNNNEKKKHRKGLFGRKKSSGSHKLSEEEEVAAEKKDAYDPYANNTASDAYGSDPYAEGSYNNNNSGNNYSTGYGGNIYDKDPYSNTYGNSSTSPGVNDPYGSNVTSSKADLNDPYGVNSSNDPYGRNSYNNNDMNAQQPSTSSLNPDNRKLETPTSSQPNPYSRRSEPPVSGQPNPYGTNRNNLNSANNISSRNNSVRATPASTNPYGSHSGTVTPSSNISHEQKPSSGANPYNNMQSDTYGSRAGSANPYEIISNTPAYGAPSNINSSNPYGISKTTTYNSTMDNPRESYAPSTRNNGMMTTMYATDDANKVAVADDLNATLNEYNVVDDDDDLNADLSERLQNENVAGQLQQQAAQPAWQMEEETLQQKDNQNLDQQHNYYGGEAAYQYQNPQEESRGYKTFGELQREEEVLQQQEEDEAVDELKQQIRFTKQSSVASTRNTLRMAQEAEMAGMNTLGMLGHQSEKLNNVERNLDLIKLQNTVADEKVAELKKLNRNILAVHVSNPFNSKRRQREREDVLKNRKLQEKMMLEATNNEIHKSTQRIENAMNSNAHSDSGIREKYQRQQVLEKAKRYQFENDEEDDEMEVEIDRNLDQIKQISGRLKKLAVSTGDELNAQHERLDRIENDTDDLDIKINMNTTRLAGIR